MQAKNVAKNSLVSILCQVVIIVTGFFSQCVVNLQLGRELVGMNGVISNVISIFSVTELGFATAVTFHLYRALAGGEEREIAGLMNLYRKAYRIVACIVTMLGLIFLPFIHLVMRESHFSVAYTRVIYALWLVRTVAGYFLSYKRAIVIADQREYVVSLATAASDVFNYLCIIVVVTLTKNYVLAMSLNVGFEILVNYVLGVYVDRSYPYLRTYRRQATDVSTVKRVFRDIKSIFVTGLSQKLLICTDNLIMSGFVSVGVVGLYANYCMITLSLLNVLQALANALQPTFGNLAVEQNKKKDYQYLKMLSLLYFFLAAVVFSGFASMGTPFVTDFWLTKSFALPDRTVMICAVNCFLQILVMPIGIFLNVSGLFQEEKKVAFTSAITNLALSLWLVQTIGIDGVLLGTFFAYLIQLFGKSLYYFYGYLQISILPYLLSVIFYLVLGMAQGSACRWLFGRIYREGSLLSLCLCGAVCVLLPFVINTLIFWRTESFRFFRSIVSEYWKNKKETQKNKKA